MKKMKYKCKQGIGFLPIIGEIIPYKRVEVGKMTCPDDVVPFIEEANKSKKIRGMLVGINSPDGAVVSSREIFQAIKDFEKPTVAWIRDIGTSGAYEIAMGCDKIIADPFSLVGSIGVLLMHVEISNLMDKLGVSESSLKTGEFKDIGSPFRKMTDDEKKILQQKLDKTHEGLVEEVAKNRKLTKEKVEKIANGMSFLGKQALEYGLVDKLGAKNDCIKSIEEMGNFKHDKIVEICKKEEKGLLSILFSSFRGYDKLLENLFTKKYFKI